MRSREQGFTLFELMLVLALCAVLLMSSWQAFQSVRQQREKSQALAAVQAVLMGAAMQPSNQFSVSQLIEMRLLRQSKINNPLLTDFSLQYIDHPIRIICTAYFKKTLTSAEQSAIAKTLNAELNHDTHQLEWHTTPTAALQPISSFWMMQAQLQNYVKRVSHASTT